MEPLQAMTPQSFDGDSMFGDDMGEDMGLTGSLAGTPAPEKKQVKKRKSWGQQLPEPKTNLLQENEQRQKTRRNNVELKESFAIVEPLKHQGKERDKKLIIFKQKKIKSSVEIPIYNYNWQICKLNTKKFVES
jgi:hypothetical protein